MPNIASVLKSEIVRLARKEVRSELESLKKASAGFRSDIAGLKRHIRQLESTIKKASKAPRPARGDGVAPVESRNSSFRPAGLKAHRTKLGLSAKSYGLLVGASALSVYKWEAGKVKPRGAALERLARVRQMGKREALRTLDALQPR